MTDPTAPDPFDLARFVAAQAGVYPRALAEVRAGRKASHWMWFVFPQLEGLGTSANARRYALRDRDEAAAYLAHPLLGARLVEISGALLAFEGRTAKQILGVPDDAKLRSCATLFAEVSTAGSVFERVLDRYFAGARDPETLRRLPPR